MDAETTQLAVMMALLIATVGGLGLWDKYYRRHR